MFTIKHFMPSILDLFCFKSTERARRLPSGPSCLKSPSAVTSPHPSDLDLMTNLPLRPRRQNLPAKSELEVPLPLKVLPMALLLPPRQNQAPPKRRIMLKMAQVSPRKVMWPSSTKAELFKDESMTWRASLSRSRQILDTPGSWP